MRILTILFLFLLVSPVYAQLTKEDLRTIIKEEVRPIIKEEITASEKRMREYIDLKIDTVNARIDALDQKVDALDKNLNARIDAVDKNLNARIGSMWRVVLALIGLITAAIAIPQLVIAYRDKGQKDMERRWNVLQAELQELREQIKTPPSPPASTK